MIHTVVTVVFTFILLLVLYGVFRWVKTPYYRVGKARMIQVLELVLTGQATENDWRITFGMTIRHDPELEALRLRCCEIEEHYFITDSSTGYLFTPPGLELLKQELSTLQNQ